MKPSGDKVPDGWKTSIQIAEESNASKKWVLERLGFGLKNKAVERKDFRVPNSDGILRLTPHYKFK